MKVNANGIKTVRVKCDNCNKLFNINVKEKMLLTDPVVKIKYFECKKCNKKYLVEIFDYISEMIKEQIKLNLKKQEDLKTHENFLRMTCEDELKEEGFYNL